jgi:uncharacterized membrane protein
VAPIHPVLDEALRQLGLSDDTPALRRAADSSCDTLKRAREYLTEKLAPDGVPLDVVVAGSYARQEASGESDFDYLVVAYELLPPKDVRYTRQLLRATDEFIAQLAEQGDQSRRPGATGLFGHIIAAPDLTERIGLEQDTNVSHTRRLLLLQESASIYQPALRRGLLESMLHRYMADYDQAQKAGPPRFLLNDCIRYWYTLTVDYQAKRWEYYDRQWGLRYLKLLTSRKLSYAGTLVSLLRCGEDQPATVPYLLDEFDKPPLARLAQLALDPRFTQHDDLRTALTIAESFSAFLAERDLRDMIKDVKSIDDARSNPLWQVRDDEARQLHEALLKVFQQSFLAEASSKYLMF